PGADPLHSPRAARQIANPPIHRGPPGVGRDRPPTRPPEGPRGGAPSGAGRPAAPAKTPPIPLPPINTPATSAIAMSTIIGRASEKKVRPRSVLIATTNSFL